jgi:hypothetical protein
MVARIMPRGLGFFFVPLIFSSLSQKGKKKEYPHFTPSCMPQKADIYRFPLGRGETEVVR